jgi:hypothetical protein
VNGRGSATVHRIVKRSGDTDGNPHFGKLADVWKHLVLNEALTAARPVRYAETHAGSGAYTTVDDAERRYGVLGFLAEPSSPPLKNAAFTRFVSGFVGRRPSLYPGSALQAMALLGSPCSYLLCDTDPASAHDLRRWADDLCLSRCEVTPQDGLSAVHGWLPDAVPPWCTSTRSIPSLRGRPASRPSTSPHRSPKPDTYSSIGTATTATINAAGPSRSGLAPMPSCGAASCWSNRSPPVGTGAEPRGGDHLGNRVRRRPRQPLPNARRDLPTTCGSACTCLRGQTVAI